MHDLLAALVLSTSWVVAARESATIPCDTTFHSSGNDTCSPSCGYTLRCISHHAKYTELVSMCVPEEKCYSMLPTGTPDKSDNWRCASCEIAGCRQCLTSKKCAECGEGFVMGTDGLCTWSHWNAWAVVAGICGVIALWITIDCIRAYLSSTTNYESLQAGFTSRWQARLRDKFVRGRPEYGLCSNMHSHVEGRAPIGGPGMTLFMNWFLLVFAVGVWLSALAYIYAPPWKSSLAEPPEGVASRCHVRAREGKEDYRDHVEWAALNYIGAVIISAFFFVWQSILWTGMTHDTEGDISLRYYCVEARGFPPTAVDKAELLRYFQRQLELLGFAKNGVQYLSIAYAYSPEERLLVDKALGDHLHAEEAAAKLHCQSSLTSPRSARASRILTEYLTANISNFFAHDSRSSGTSSDESSASDEYTEDPGPFWVRLLAFIMTGLDSDIHCCNKTLDNAACGFEAPEEEHIDVFNLENSGTVFVVMRMETTAVGMACVGTLPEEFRSQHEIRVRRCRSEPQGVKWHNFDVGGLEFIRRCMVSAFILVVALTVWFLLYAPFARLTMTVSSFNYSSMLAMGLENAMSLLIALGNCMLSVVAAVLTEYMGFRNAAKQQLAQLAILIPCVGANCLMDFFVTTYSAVQQMSEHLEHSVKVEVVQDALLWLLFPSYVLIPYLAEPCVTIAGAVTMAHWRIKRDGRVKPRQAEEAMIAQQTDVTVVFADMICTTSTIVATFLLGPSMHHRALFPLILVFTAVVYVIYRVRILRWETSTYLGEKSLHVCQSVYWMLPLGILAASWERSVHRCTECANLSGARAFAMHCGFHLLFLRFVLPAFSPEVPSSKLTYTEAIGKLDRKAGLADYLNTNPIEVLRSRQQPEVSNGRQLVFYRIDKEHLQERAAKFDASEEMQGELQLLTNDAKDVVSTVAESVRNTASSLRRQIELTSVTPSLPTLSSFARKVDVRAAEYNA